MAWDPCLHGCRWYTEEGHGQSPRFPRGRGNANAFEKDVETCPESHLWDLSERIEPVKYALLLDVSMSSSVEVQVSHDPAEIRTPWIVLLQPFPLHEEPVCNAQTIQELSSQRQRLDPGDAFYVDNGGLSHA